MLSHLKNLAMRALIWIVLPWLLSWVGRFLDIGLSFPFLPGLVQALLLTVGGIGLLLAVWGSLQRGMLGTYLNSEDELDGGTGLQTRGPYHLCRHPVYWGYSLLLLGWAGVFAVSTGPLLIVPAVTAAWIVYVLVKEEPSLLRRYGQRAQEWRATTPLLPDPRRWRSAVAPPSIPPLYLFLRGICRPLLKFWCGLSHPPMASIPPDGPLVVVANHRSYLDGFLLAAAFPRPISFLTSAEAFRPAWQRLFLRGLGCIRLRRYTPDAGAIRLMMQTLRAGGVVGIFPEGERSWDGGPSPILPGVSRLLALSRAPVLSVNLAGSYRLWPRWGRGPRRAEVVVRWAVPATPGRDRDIELWLVDELSSHPSDPALRSRSAADVGRLIWRCPACGRSNAIRGLPDGSVYCLGCDIEGRLHDGTHLELGSEGPLPLRAWARSVALSVEERRELAPPGPIPNRRWSFLRLSDGKGDDPLTKRGKGEAVLTPEALVLRARQWRAYIPAGSIRSVTVEGSHKLQVATSERIYEIRYRRGSPRGPRTHLEAWLDSRGIIYRRG
ncbi:1-acyl-sn-glycerol-3-phosphate acyltransferase [Candidatus Zixiibacteriota bacterium]